MEIKRVMTPRRAFWEATVTICVPTLVIWGTLLYLLRAKLSWDEVPFLLIFIALPFPLIIPMYKRYLRGTSTTKLSTPRSHYIFAVGAAVLGSVYIIDTVLHHGDRKDLATKLIIGIAWLLIGVDHVRRAAQARKAGRQTPTAT
jgi:hypothetical protein